MAYQWVDEEVDPGPDEGADGEPVDRPHPRVPGRSRPVDDPPDPVRQGSEGVGLLVERPSLVEDSQEYPRAPKNTINHKQPPLAVLGHHYALPRPADADVQLVVGCVHRQSSIDWSHCEVNIGWDARLRFGTSGTLTCRCKEG